MISGVLTCFLFQRSVDDSVLEVALEPLSKLREQPFVGS